MWQCKQCYLEIWDFPANPLTLTLAGWMSHGCYLRFLFVLTLNSVLEMALVQNSSDEQNTEEVRHHTNHHHHHRQKTKIKLRLENIKLLAVTSSTSQPLWPGLNQPEPACLPDLINWSTLSAAVSCHQSLCDGVGAVGTQRPRCRDLGWRYMRCLAQLNWFDFQPNTSSMTLLSGRGKFDATDPHGVTGLDETVSS